MSSTMQDNAVNSAKVNTACDQVKGDIVTKGFDYLNKNKAGSGSGAVGDLYDLNKSILSAAYEGKGTILDTKTS